MSLISGVLIVALLSFVPCCFSLEEFRCKAVPGCEIDTRCHPSPLSYANLERDEFPINCISDKSAKEKVYENRVKTLEEKVEDLTSELQDLQKDNDRVKRDMEEIVKRVVNSEDVKAMVKKIARKGAVSCQDVNLIVPKHKTESGGVYDIYAEELERRIEVSCDLETDGGGWTVFQRRMDGSENFYRGWDDYVNGFGRKDKEFWLGLENIHQMTKNGDCELRVQLKDFDGKQAYANYGSFRIDSSAQNYRLHVSSYSGNAGDSLARHNGKEFSAMNADHDTWSSGNCAEYYKGAWWYDNCYHSDLNTLYQKDVYEDNGLFWYHWKSDEYRYLKFTEMKFRRK